MFNKSIKEGQFFKTYTILSTSAIPRDLSILDKSMYTLLQQIVCLIKQKYGINDDYNNERVRARFTSSDYTKANIILLNGLQAHDESNLDKSYKALINFLQSHNGIKTIDQQKQQPYLSYFVISVNTSDLVKVLKGLEKLVMSIHEDGHTLSY